MPNQLREINDQRTRDTLGIGWSYFTNDESVSYVVTITYTDASGAIRTETSGNLDTNTFVF
jgi:hypothetical protein